MKNESLIERFSEKYMEFFNKFENPYIFPLSLVILALVLFGIPLLGIFMFIVNYII
jgi:hypothetical protein